MLKEYEMPFQNEVGEHPTLEDMQVAVVNKKLRPALDPTWCQNEVRCNYHRSEEINWNYSISLVLSCFVCC